MRVTIIAPGVTETELADLIPDAKGREEMKRYRNIAIAPAAIARAIGFGSRSPPRSTRPG